MKTLEFGQGENAHVAIITGAARGLGKAWAIALAARGVRVVANDNDQDHSLVDKVVDVIKSRGGIAVADYHCATEGAKLVDAVVKRFGRVDILINNATVIRDGSFRKIMLENWDAVYRSSVLGTFAVTQAVWPLMRKQKYGRIINCTSGAGLYGNFGQVNYATMKMALVGFTTALNREGVKYNIQVNAVSPVAGTRLTQPVMPKDVHDALKPELTSPILVYLCHPSCQEAGSLFELGGGWVGKLRLQRTHGVGFPTDVTSFTPELVAEHWKDIVDFSRVTHPSTTQESFEPMMRNITSPPTSLVTSRSQECSEVFNRLRSTLESEGPALAKQISGVTEWHISNETWTVWLLNGKGSVIEGKDSRYTPDLYIDMDEESFMELATGRLRIQQALIRKKLRIHGNMKLAMKLQPFADLLQRPHAKL
ncbi:hypothetical protein Poli38472_009234 [Pythium oligandrum]|uniref:Ketoreductase domain-containing protein n=1 Tax=Pythium oligandrum TaxID=41045 RepID=A0A8K1CMH3_PYTOL|nr:hypothetical protein Poli38472_009234 [Pythium oligandrum]|eukprot:TMW65067.1 hypothetical protein Poli38472_009234 [Pythium oligandrum]